MNNDTASAKHHFGVWLIFFCLLGTSMRGLAQSWNWAVGPTMTQFDFVNSKGVPFSHMRPSSGLMLDLTRRSAFLDTVRLFSSTSQRALFFRNHPQFSQILSHGFWGLGVNYQQLNAVGDVQQMAFSYQTDYLGALLYGGMHVHLLKQWELGLSAVFLPAYLWNGNQLVQNQYVALAADEQFNHWKFLGGYQIHLMHPISSQFRAFVQIRQLSSLWSPKTPSGTLDMRSTSISFGISFNR